MFELLDFLLMMFITHDSDPSDYVRQVEDEAQERAKVIDEYKKTWDPR